MSNQLEVQDVSVSYGAFVAVKDVSLHLEQGQIGCLLGPSGCGKTTLLRAIAGFEPIGQGQIKLHGRLISDPHTNVAPEQRRVGMVFQDFALFPHLSVARNIGFGLTGLKRAARRKRVKEMLELVELDGAAAAYPDELSGGQQQRVALARALAPEPDILLLDEPFSSLDSELREQLAGEVRGLLKHNNVTAVLVTHDQHEAFAMADQVSVMREGGLAQSGTPYQLYHEPADEFVAGFIGLGSVVQARVDAGGELDNALGTIVSGHGPQANGETLRVLVRPEDIHYDEHSPVRLTVVGKSFRGASFLYELALADGQRVFCFVPGHVDIAIGEDLPVRFDLRHAVNFQA